MVVNWPFLAGNKADLPNARAEESAFKSMNGISFAKTFCPILALGDCSQFIR